MIQISPTLILLFIVGAAWTVVTAQECVQLGAGLHCSSDCKSVILCVSNTPQPITTITCDAGKFCKENNSTYQCTGTSCSNVNPPFLCTDPGIFPSAVTCESAYICTAANTEPVLECTCPKDEQYDLATGNCLPNTEQSCSRPDTPCNEPGVQGSLQNGFCYTCDQSLNPVVFRCISDTTPGTPSETETPPEGGSEMFAAAICGEYTGGSSPETTTETPTVPSDSPTNTTDPATTVTPTQPPTPACTAGGQKFPAPGACNSYLYCRYKGDPNPELRACAVGYYYDATKFACVKGTCTNTAYYDDIDYYYQ